MGYKESAVKNAIYSACITLLLSAIFQVLDELMGITARELGLLDLVILYFIINIKLDLAEKQK